MKLRRDIREKTNYSILIGISFIFVVVSLVVGICYYNRISKDNVTNTLKYNESLVNLIQNKLDSELKEMKYIDYYIEINDSIQNYLQGLPFSESDKTDIMHLLYRLKGSMKQLDDICIYSEDEDIIISSRNITKPDIYFETQCNMLDYNFENWKNEYLLRSRNKEFYPEQKIKLSDTFSKNIIVYKRTLFPTLSSRGKLHILMMIRTDAIERIMNEVNTTIGNDIFIYDLDGNAIYRTDKNTENFDIEKTYWEKEGIVEDNDDYTIYKKSENLNLIYSIRLSKDLVLYKVNSFMRIGIFIIVLYLILIILYVYFSIRISYRPIKIIMDRMANGGKKKEKNSSEIDFITVAIDDLLKNNEQYIKNDKLKSYLFGNDSIDENEYNEWTDKCFLVSVVRVFDVNHMDLDNEQYQMVKYNILSVMKELTQKFVKCDIVETNKNDIVSIFNFNESKYEFIIDEIERVMAEVSNIILEMQQNITITITTALSSVHSDAKGISKCYKEAMAAIDFRSINDEENLSIIYYDDICDSKKSQNIWYYWPANIQEILSDYTEQGDYNSVDKTIDEIIQISLKSPRDINVLGECIYYNIFGVLLNIASKHINTYSIIDMPQYNKNIPFNDNIKIIKNKFMEVCSLMENGNKDNKKLLIKIEKYIDEHFMENNLDLTKIADNVEITPNYLSAYFKKHKNITLIKYITQKRMEYAKQMLTDTNLSISAIAVNVGFTDVCVFSKVFKKNEKMTPSMYRERFGGQKETE